MESFLEKVISDINLRNADLKSICFILPNKRSSIYFKQKILDKSDRNQPFAPVNSQRRLLSLLKVVWA